MLQKFLTLKTLLLGVIILILVGAVYFFLAPTKLPDNASTKKIASVYPENPTSFTLPPLGENVAQHIAEDDKGLGNWFSDQKADPSSEGVRFSIYPAPEMRPKDLSMWLTKSQPFSGTLLLQPYFPANRTQDDIAFKAFLDGKEIRLATDGNLVNVLILHFASGERKVINFETENIPEGVHTLSFMYFRDINNDSTNLSIRRHLGKLNFDGQSFIVHVQTNNPISHIQFDDWDAGSSNLPEVQDYFDINDGQSTDVRKPWTPQPFQPSANVSFGAVIYNPGSIDREYCLVALLDYNQIPIQNNYQSCGIVKAGQVGGVKSSFVAPSTIGDHQFQVVAIENPSMKDSYFAADPNVKGINLISSTRVLIQVQK